MLINEENPPDYVVTALRDDGNFAVAGTARWHQAHPSGISSEARETHRNDRVASQPSTRATTVEDEFEVGKW